MERPLKAYSFYQKLEHLPFVQGIFLFGSRARGTHRPKSDIDLAISCPEATELDWLKVVEIIDEADTLIKIDCVRLDALTENDPFQQNILKEAVPLYERR